MCSAGSCYSSIRNTGTKTERQHGTPASCSGSLPAPRNQVEAPCEPRVFVVPLCDDWIMLTIAPGAQDLADGRYPSGLLFVKTLPRLLGFRHTHAPRLAQQSFVVRHFHSRRTKKRLISRAYTLPANHATRAFFLLPVPRQRHTRARRTDRTNLPNRTKYRGQ